MKDAAGYFVTILKPHVAIIILALFPVFYFIWSPLLYVYTLVHILVTLAVGKTVISSILNKGWPATRSDLAAAMQLVREEQAAAEREEQLAIEASKAKLREALEGDTVSEDKTKDPNETKPEAMLHEMKEHRKAKKVALGLVPDPEPEDDNDEDDKPQRPQLRLVNDDK